MWGWSRARLAASASALVALSACGTAASRSVLVARVATAPPETPVAATTPVPPPPTPAPTPSAIPTPAPTPVDCATAALARMDPATRAGQLLMVGVPSGPPGAGPAIDAVRRQHAGGIVLFGDGWNGRGLVSRVVSALQAAAIGGPGLLVSGNQEGGQAGTFQAFYGPGFSTIPGAVAQGALSPDTLTALARSWAGDLRAAGVNLDLAPVVDTVAPGADAANAAIGALGRELGHDPTSIGAHGAAIVRGLQSAGVAATLKHFPGLGRVAANTDFSASGISDSATTADDPALAAFRAGIVAGTRFVMVSTATYERIDPTAPAAFSPVIVTDLLRSRLGFAGVVISDDLGQARSVAAFSPGDRAVRFVAAGGDIVLTILPGQAAEMEAALVGRMASDPAFAGLVNAAALRVLHAKAALGLLPGC